MNYFLQAQSLANIIPCLCDLFANQGSYEPNVQAKIQLIRTKMQDLANDLKTELENNGISVNFTGNTEDPCAYADYLLKLLNMSWFHEIEPVEEPGSQGVDDFTTILSLYGEVLGDIEESPCEPPFDAQLKLDVPCVCRMLGLLGKLSGTVNDEIQELHNRFEQLKQLVEQRAQSILPEPIEWPVDICAQVELLAKLLCIISLRQDLADAPLIAAYNSFVQQRKLVKDSLAVLGIYPCEDEIELGSDKIYIQAAGSQGSDGSVSGVHLRWTFLSTLGDAHLAKGNLTSLANYTTDIAYNKTNDFIRVFKFPYTEESRAAICIDFTTLTYADIKVDNFSTVVYWTIQQKISGSTETVRITFADPLLYTNTPGSSPSDLINNYTDVIEISLDNRHLFAGEFHLNNANTSTNEYESVSEYYSEGEADQIVSARIKDNSLPTSYTRRIVNEEIKFFRLKNGGNATITKICLESHHLFYFKNLHLINTLGDQYALTDQNSVANNRLQDLSRFTIDKIWPSFNNSVTMKTSSYENKWSQNNEGIKELVTKYLTLSTVDVKAIEDVNSDDPNDPDDTSTFEVSYLDAINIASADFHLARMLGLGEIDETVNSSDSFIYMMEYKMRLPGTDIIVPLLYFTLPTSQADQRLPQKPILKPIEYGFTPLNDDSDHIIKIDAQGYAPYGNNRFIRLNREELPYENPGLDFFENTDEFDRGIITSPIRYGIEYKNQSDPDFVKPEITADASSPFFNHDQTSGGDIAENDPVIENDGSLYVHTETTEGFHDYAIYGINWFNRISATSLPKGTNETIFPPKESLLPPSKTQILLLQEDLTELAVTSAELTANKNKLRVKFDWNHLQNINYPNVNKVEFFHRVDPALEIKGKISTITAVGNGDKFDLQTTFYVRNSVFPAVTVHPTIATTAEANAYIGGRLFVGGKPYIITDISNLGNAPIIQIEGEEVITKTFDSEQPRKVNLSKTYEAPDPDSFFSAVESLEDEANWNKLNKVIDIVHFGSPEYTETEVDDNNQVNVFTIGGITENTTITKYNSDPDSQLYRIKFNSKSLAAHPQQSSENVKWVEGVARVKLTTQTLELRVVEHVQTSPEIELLVLNDSGVTLPANAEVNFHPSYLVYIDKETATGFDDANLLPLSGEQERTTYFTLRSIDDTKSPKLRSKMAKTIDLNSHRIYDTKAPVEPLGATFATRPDTFGKSTYSLDSEIDTTGGREPYGMMFLRSNEDRILNALYKTSTITAIKTNLDNLGDDSFHSTRFYELANVVLNGSGDFKTYPPTSGFAFPTPDNVGNLAGLSPQQKKDKLLPIIEATFVPLTKEPVLYSNIKIGYKTENKEPVIRNDKGKLLSHGDADPYPMIRKYQDGSKWKVRFTDYTLDGASQNDYFYFAREIDMNYRFGEGSGIKGPIQLINSKAPDKPELVSINTVLADPSIGQLPGVQLEINPYEESQNIKKIRLFRSTSAQKALSVQLMDTVAEFNIGDELIDEFADLTDVPFGENLYYRLVALREINNEQNAIEYIISIPSEIIEAKVVDNINPSAPIISFTATDDPTTLTAVQLSWAKTTHNGKYYLYKMTSSGTWQKIHEVESNDSLITVALLDTDLASGQLDKFDADGNRIYHRFKVDAENSNGLMNLNEEIATISDLSPGISSNGTDGMAIGSTFIVS